MLFAILHRYIINVMAAVSFCYGLFNIFMSHQSTDLHFNKPWNSVGPQSDILTKLWGLMMVQHGIACYFLHVDSRSSKAFAICSFIAGLSSLYMSLYRALNSNIFLIWSAVHLFVGLTVALAPVKGSTEKISHQLQQDSQSVLNKAMELAGQAQNVAHTKAQ